MYDSSIQVIVRELICMTKRLLATNNKLTTATIHNRSVLIKQYNQTDEHDIFIK